MNYGSACYCCVTLIKSLGWLRFLFCKMGAMKVPYTFVVLIKWVNMYKEQWLAHIAYYTHLYSSSYRTNWRHVYLRLKGRELRYVHTSNRNNSVLMRLHVTIVFVCASSITLYLNTTTILTESWWSKYNLVFCPIYILHFLRWVMFQVWPIGIFYSISHSIFLRMNMWNNVYLMR